MTTKYGVFSEPTYIGIHDPYIKRNEQKKSDVTLNFKASLRKTGKGNDATFDKFKALFDGEKYVDPQREKLLQLSEKKKKNITDSAWRQVSPMKRSTGRGDAYGTFQGKVPYEPGNACHKMKKGDYQAGPPNLFTNPGKKGSYGFNKTTIGERKGHAGVVGEYGYAADPFDAGIKAVKEYEKMKREKRIADLPFRPANPSKKGGYGVPGTTLNGKGPGVAGEYAYTPQGPAALAGSEKVENPFRPSHPPKGGYNATLNRFPKHVADPELPKIMEMREARKKEREALGAQNPWKPSLTYRSDCTRSVIQMNV